MTMKKILLLLCSVLMVFSCQDFNEDNFDGYEEWEKPLNVANYELTMVSADYTTIVNALNANKNAADSATAAKLKAAGMFSEDLDATALIPYLLQNKYYSADVKSSAKVTYQYNSSRDNVVAGLTGAGYIMTSADYKTIWGKDVSALTPAKSPVSAIPTILKTKVSSPEEGDYKTVEYYYSEEEPVTTTVENKFVDQDFEGLGLNANDPVAASGWLNVDLLGSRSWQMKSYTSAGVTNFYAQASSNGSKEKNDNWMIANAFTLSATDNPNFSFDVKIGYYNASCLHIMISSDFDGNKANIATATWTDITDKFTIPTTPTSGYGADFVSAGSFNLSAYKGKKVYIAFRYMGDDTSTPKATTTYQIDNVKVNESVTGFDVKSKYAQYASFVYTQDKWQAASNNVVVIQPEDYKAMSLTAGTLATNAAPNYLPTFLSDKYRYAQNGDEYVVVYRTKSNEYYADRITKESNDWVINSFKEAITDQFVFAQLDNRKAWIFDPTLIFTIEKVDYQNLVDHVKENEAIGNEGVLDSRGNAEFYYGFNAYYPNITYRNIDRIKDNTFPVDGALQEQITFMNQRTIDGLAIILSMKYPDATPLVSGVEQFAKVNNVRIYSDPTDGAPLNRYWTYQFKCVGDKEWEFIERESTDGVKETAK